MSAAAKFRLRVTLSNDNDPGGVTLLSDAMTQAEANDEARRLVKIITRPTRALIEVIDQQGRVVIERRRA